MHIKYPQEENYSTFPTTQFVPHREESLHSSEGPAGKRCVRNQTACVMKSYGTQKYIMWMKCHVLVLNLAVGIVTTRL